MDVSSPLYALASAAEASAPFATFSFSPQHERKDVDGASNIGISLIAVGDTCYEPVLAAAVSGCTGSESGAALAPLATGSGASVPPANIHFKDVPSSATEPNPSRTSTKRKRDRDDQSDPATPHSSHSHGVTPAERTREKRLRDDELVILLNPQLVQCRRCDSLIKLSTKSAFDVFHWKKHRERCLRRSSSDIENIKAEAAKQPPKSSKATAELVTRPALMRRRVENSATPPLTADDSAESDDLTSEGTVKGEEPADVPVAVAIRDPDHAFVEYLVRTHRRPRTGALELLDWKTWSWSQLSEPIWPRSKTGFGGYDSDDSDYCATPLVPCKYKEDTHPSTTPSTVASFT